MSQLRGGNLVKQSVLQQHTFHKQVVTLEIEEIKLCTRMTIKLGYSMLIFWYVNSIWELEGGSFSKGKGRPQWGKMSFNRQATFLSCCFSRTAPLPARNHWLLFGFKGNSLLVSVGFHWGPVPKHQLGADGPIGVKTLSVEAEKCRFLAGSNCCTPLQQQSMMCNASSHPQMSELIKDFFPFLWRTA